MRLLLIPECGGSNVVCQRLILTVGPPSECLDCNLQVAVEDDGIRDVPPVQAPLGRPIWFLGFVIEHIVNKAAARFCIYVGDDTFCGESLGTVRRDGDALTKSILTYGVEIEESPTPMIDENVLEQLAAF